jgi:hypothetical protein
VLCEESASIGWARVTRGIESMEKAVTPRAATAATSSVSTSGCSSPIRTWPSRSEATSSGDGLSTLQTASACV